jgi:hypothetical protein
MSRRLVLGAKDWIRRNRVESGDELARRRFFRDLDYVYWLAHRELEIEAQRRERGAR